MPSSTTGLLYNEDGLESAKPDLQSTFKKPDGLAWRGSRACARTAKWETLRRLLMPVEPVGVRDGTRCHRGTWPRGRPVSCWSSPRGLSRNRRMRNRQVGRAYRAGSDREANLPRSGLLE